METVRLSSAPYTCRNGCLMTMGTQIVTIAIGEGVAPALMTGVERAKHPFGNEPRAKIITLRW